MGSFANRAAASVFLLAIAVSVSVQGDVAGTPVGSTLTADDEPVCVKLDDQPLFCPRVCLHVGAEGSWNTRLCPDGTD